MSRIDFIEKYELSPDVFFRKTPKGDVLLYQTSKQNVMLLDGQIYDLLNILRSNRGLVSYDIEVSKSVIEKIDESIIADAIKQLTDMGWILGPNVLEEKLNTLETGVKINHYRDTHSLSDVQFELTFRCNERCRHCYCPRENEIQKELSTEEIKTVLDDLELMGVVTVTFTGGDLFIREDTFEILEYAYAKGFAINIFTNGTLLKDSDFFRLKQIHPRSIHFSIYNYIPEKHDAFTCLPGSFEKTVSAIKKCKLLGIPTNIKVSLVEENYNDIEGICRLAESLGTTIQISMQITPKNDGGMEPTNLRLKNAARYAEVMKKVDRHIFLSCAGDFVSEEDNLINGKICGAGEYALNINPYGEVFPCNALLMPCGNIRNQSIKEIWDNSDTLKKIRFFTMDKIKGCENCHMKTKCDFCPGSAMQETGDPLMKYSEACAIAEAKIIKEKGE